MHAVVNHLPLKPDADWADIATKFDAFSKGVMAEYPKMRTAVVIRVSDAAGIFVGVYDDVETMQHVSSNVAAPWFAENIRPYLSGPTDRQIGEVVAGFAR